MPAAAAALLIAVLVGPALFVLLFRDDGGGNRPETLSVARLPTDVAVDGKLVYSRYATGRFPEPADLETLSA